MESRLVWYGDAVLAQNRSRMVPAVTKGAEYLLEQANRTVPIEEGTLERSGAVSAAMVGSAAKAAASYNTPYARRQHEDLSLRHDAGRRAKWLELTAQEQAQAIVGIIGRELSR